MFESPGVLWVSCCHQGGAGETLPSLCSDGVDPTGHLGFFCPSMCFASSLTAAELNFKVHTHFLFWRLVFFSFDFCDVLDWIPSFHPTAIILVVMRREKKAHQVCVRIRIRDSVLCPCHGLYLSLSGQGCLEHLQTPGLFSACSPLQCQTSLFWCTEFFLCPCSTCSCLSRCLLAMLWWKGLPQGSEEL